MAAYPNYGGEFFFDLFTPFFFPEDSTNKVQDSLAATWQSPDFEVSQMGGFTFRRYQFNKDGTWNSSFSSYTSQDSQSGGFTVEEEGIDYNILEEHSTLADTYILELTRGKIFLTIRDIDTYNTFF